MKLYLRILLSGLVAASLPAAPPTAIAIRDARVVTMAGPALERGTVVMRDGLIEAAGANVSPPADAWTIEGEGLTVYPGLINALSNWGLPPAGDRKPAAEPDTPRKPIAGPEDRPATESWRRAADLIQAGDKRLEDARHAGFTTAVVFPAGGIFAGQGAVVNLAGERPGDMVIEPLAGQRLNLEPSGGRTFPASLMGVIAYVRQVYLDASQYRQAKDIYESGPAGLSRPAYDRALEGVLESPRVLLPADRAVELRRAIGLARDIGQPAVLYGGHQACDAADALSEAGYPVLVNLKWPARHPQADPEQEDELRILELREKAPSTPAALRKAGVRFAFYSLEIEKPAEILAAVRRAADAGLSQEDAVRALTLSAAEIYSVADRIGSIEPGKIANLVVTDGDLLAEKTRVKYVFVDGVQFTPPVEVPKKEETK